MELDFDPHKHAKTLAERALDFADTVHVFQGAEWTREDKRRSYGERRSITIGELAGVMVVVGWTPRKSRESPYGGYFR